MLIEQINIELTNNCNAKCVICPHEKMKRPKGDMDDGLVRHIIDQCDRIPEIHYNLFGEPFLNSRIVEYIAYARKKFPSSKQVVFTNGSLIGKYTDELLRMENRLDRIVFSIDGGDKESYESHRVGLSYDNVISGIQRFVFMRNELGIDTHILIAMAVTDANKHTIRRLFDFWNSILNLPYDGVYTVDLINWAGKISVQGTYQPQSRCPWLWNKAFILWNGRACLCCVDQEGEYDLGNAWIQTLHGIVNSQEINKVRKLYLDKKWDELPLCRSCVLGGLET